MPTLNCKRVRFYSEADESAFFHFAKSIKAVKRIEGVGGSIMLHVSSRPSRQSLQDLIALFRRYRIPRMSQLGSFRNVSNQDWFTDARTFWHQKVFQPPP